MYNKGFKIENNISNISKNGHRPYFERPRDPPI